MTEQHWRDRFFFAGIVSSSLAGVILGVLLGFVLPHDIWMKARRSVRVALRRERPRWELLTQ